jgi:protein-tyrosine phosphatase
MNGILFVCMGNICRSPTVEAVARAEFARAGMRIETASAATHDYHIGEPADARAIACARAHGYALDAHRAQQVTPALLARFAVVLAMDHVNLRDLSRLAPQASAQLFLPYCGIDAPAEVPDPYYGSQVDFAHVVELAQRGVRALVERAMAHNMHMPMNGSNA